MKNDMDDLFKRAAENYPLQPGKGDWESVVKRIENEPEPAEIIVPLKNKRNRKFIVVPVLFFILLGGWLIFRDNRPGYNMSGLTKNLQNKNEEQVKSSNPEIPGKESLDTYPEKNKSDNYKKSTTTFRVNSSAKIITGISNAPFNNMENSNKEKLKDKGINEKGESNTRREIPGEELTKNLQNTTTEKSADFKKPKQDTTGTILKNILKKNDTAATTTTGKKQRQAVLNRRKRLYYGLVAGIDFSKVQSPAFNNSGFDAGIILGFRLNSKLSLESGLILNKKNYRSDGRNFSMNKVGSTMPSGMTINNLESHSSITEIPLKVKYNVIDISKSSFFASAGVSAYIMTKEKNHYDVTLNGNREKITGIYGKNDYKLPAVANISAGYEYKITEYINFSIEPFLKIPLQGMGVGNLPVTSAGLQLGITRRLQ